MFERYTEKARRVIFFARYEASQFGSPCIETEHLLLALAAYQQGHHHVLERREFGQQGVNLPDKAQLPVAEIRKLIGR